MAPMVLPSFVENGPKLRVLILVIGEWPETAKNRGEPGKMILSSGTEFFLGGPNGKVVGGILVICPVDKTRDYAFSSLAANLSRASQCFQHKKGDSLVPYYKDTKVLLYPPEKMDFWLKNGQILAFFGPFDPTPDQKSI